MSENIRLTRKQVEFLKFWTEIENPEAAAEKFIDLMILEKADASDIVFYLNKVMKKAEEKAGKK